MAYEPKLLKEVLSEEEAKEITELFGSDINDTYIAEPDINALVKIASMNQLLGYDYGYIIHSCVRNSKREKVVSTDIIDKAPGSKFLKLGIECINVVMEVANEQNKEAEKKKD